MENRKIENCIAACRQCADACETCAIENKGKAGMENSVILCIACRDACDELIIEGKYGTTDLDALYTKCEVSCISCASECAKHIDMKYCKECAEACNQCAVECEAMLSVAA